MQYAFGYAPTLIIETALRFRLFDHLDHAPRNISELAKLTGASSRGLKAILNALVGLQLLARQDDRYSLTTESAAFLVSTRPAFHGGIFQHTSSQLLPRWMKLPEIVGKGKPVDQVNQESGGAEFFADFVESLFPLSYAAAQKLGEHLRLSQSTQPLQVLDLAAGSGVWGIALAQASPQVRVSAVDWPRVLEVTRKMAMKHGIADRLTTIPGDLLQVEYGNGHHFATLGHILHSEGPERSRRLLRKTFDALSPGGTIAIMEFLPNDERTGPPHALIFAVNMLVHTDSGDTFTFAEISQWLLEAGFVNPRLLEVSAQSPLVLANKP